MKTRDHQIKVSPTCFCQYLASQGDKMKFIMNMEMIQIQNREGT